jgi:hypothetical protein
VVTLGAVGRTGAGRETAADDGLGAAVGRGALGV